MSLINRGVETNAGALGRLPLIEPAGRRNEPAQPVFGIDAKFNGMAARHRAFVKTGQGRALCDLELRLDEIEAGSHFRDRMLDLDTRIHLDKEKLAGRLVENELDRSRAFVGDAPGKAPGNV